MTAWPHRDSVRANDTGCGAKPRALQQSLLLVHPTGNPNMLHRLPQLEIGLGPG
jgi:hypothetical protein